MQRTKTLDTGAILFGLVLLFAGAYYTLERTLGFALPELDWDRIWPIIVIGLGLSVLYGAYARRKDEPKA